MSSDRATNPADPSAPVSPLPDLAATSAQVESYITDRRRPAASLVRERNSWAIFVLWCLTVGVSPALPVPPEVLIAFMVDASTGKALPGRKLSAADVAAGREKPPPRAPSAAYFRNLISAIAVAHKDAGIASPTTDPKVRGVRSEIEKHLKARKTRRAAPLTPDALRKISALDFKPTFEVARRLAMTLLALETGIEIAHLMFVERRVIRGTRPSLKFTLIEYRDRTGHHVARALKITCRRSAACGTACTVCALRALDDLLPSDGEFLFAFKQLGPGVTAAGCSADRGVVAVNLDDGKALSTLRGTLARSTSSLLHKAGAPATVTSDGHVIWTTTDLAAREAAKRSLGIVADERRMALVRDRAMLLTAFHNGLRSVEVRLMLRGRVTPGRRGFNIDIGVRKAAQDGASNGMSIRPTKDPSLCPVAAMREWLDIFDAITAGGESEDDGYLFCPVTNGTVLADRAMSYPALHARLRSLSRWASISPRLTGHSARRGFAQTADDHGLSHADIMATMDLVTIDVFNTYLERGDQRDGVDVSPLFGRAS